VSLNNTNNENEDNDKKLIADTEKILHGIIDYRTFPRMKELLFTSTMLNVKLKWENREKDRKLAHYAYLEKRDNDVDKRAVAKANMLVASIGVDQKVMETLPGWNPELQQASEYLEQSFMKKVTERRFKDTCEKHAWRILARLRAASGLQETNPNSLVQLIEGLEQKCNADPYTALREPWSCQCRTCSTTHSIELATNKDIDTLVSTGRFQFFCANYNTLLHLSVHGVESAKLTLDLDKIVETYMSSFLKK
jgi:hypothetical protein